ncbi:hypothetical protein V8F06_001355 [Rhypophila decipiens]
MFRTLLALDHLLATSQAMASRTSSADCDKNSNKIPVAMEYHDPLERELENCSAGDSCNGSIVANLQEPTQPITMDQHEFGYVSALLHTWKSLFIRTLKS